MLVRKGVDCFGQPRLKETLTSLRRLLSVQSEQRSRNSRPDHDMALAAGSPWGMSTVRQLYQEECCGCLVDRTGKGAQSAIAEQPAASQAA